MHSEVGTTVASATSEADASGLPQTPYRTHLHPSTPMRWLLPIDNLQSIIISLAMGSDCPQNGATSR
jgi:hypothetical protein